MWGKKSMEKISRTTIDDYDVVVSDNRDIYVFKKGVERDIDSSAGWMSVERGDFPGTYCVSDVKVFEKRRGIATAMYQTAVNAGWRMFKSNDVTTDGEKLWASFVARGLANSHGEFVGANPAALRNDYEALEKAKSQQLLKLPSIAPLQIQAVRAVQAIAAIDDSARLSVVVRP
jgi:hypothetical protein